MRRALVLLAGLLGPALALTPAGTVIRNQAEARVGDQRYLSNPVQTVVQALCRPDLTPSGGLEAPAYRVQVGPGGRAYLRYTLSNAGNDRFTFALDYALEAAPDWQPKGVRLYQDLNQNGLPDPGEPEVQSLALGPGEAASLVLAVEAPLQGQGRLRLSPVATCPTGERDGENWAWVLLAPGPSLWVGKTMTPAELAPGAEALVELRVRNLGGAAQGEVLLLDDPLPLPLVPGSAFAPKGVVEYRQGEVWTQEEPQNPQGIRLRLAGLQAGEEALLRFRLRVPLGAPPGEGQNRARAEGPGGPGEAVAVYRILGHYEHHLGPAGNPRALPGGEGSPDDRQRLRGLAGQPLCAPLTLLNAGTAQDAYDLDLLPSPGLEAWWDPPPPTPLPLAPGAAQDLRVCLRAPGPGAYTLTVVSRGQDGPNRTWVDLETLPQTALGLEKESNPPPGRVRPGDTLTYTLVVRNALGELHEAAVEDPLDPNLEFLEASGGGVLEGGAVVWRFPTLPLGETRLTLRVRVRAQAPDGAVIRNRFLLRAKEAPSPLPSNPLEHQVLGKDLLLRKRVEPRTARVGDRLTYTLELLNPSQLAYPGVRLEDTPHPSLAYLPGSARLKPGCQGEGTPLEPRVQGGRLVWEGLSLSAEGRLCLVYGMRVLPGAPERIPNTAQAQGLTQTGLAVATAQVQAWVEREARALREEGVLMGRVYLDLNGNGRFDPGVDLPLAGARLLLANGLQTLTDGEGRYAFRGVAGVQELLLDPSSAPFPPLPHPEALGEGYRHRVVVDGGVYVSDFPLKPPQGSVTAQRETTLRMGPLTVEKRLLLTPGGPVVQLVLRSETPLEEFSLRDGGRTWTWPRFQGEAVLTYPLEGPFTDPEVRWRYP